MVLAEQSCGELGCSVLGEAAGEQVAGFLLEEGESLVEREVTGLDQAVGVEREGVTGAELDDPLGPLAGLKAEDRIAVEPDEVGSVGGDRSVGT